jgi:hypothetical protein
MTEAAEVEDFIAKIEPEQKRDDSRTLVDLMSRITGETPKLWGTIVGFGRYHYKYDSGHEGDTCLAGFAPRKAALSIYLMGNGFPESMEKAEALLGRLGRHSMGKGCLYVKKLSDVDLGVLEQLVALSVERLRQHDPG